MKLLIVDDSEFIRDTLVKLLKPVRFLETVYMASDVKEGIELVTKLRPDAVILDIRLPKGIGFDVLDAAKALNPAPMVIMLTNYTIEQYKKKAFEKGADYFFDKSAEFEKVIEIIDELSVRLVLEKTKQIDSQTQDKK
ncbi:response regulator [Bacteroidetes/Chlorobi group bacterium ChocPot_Mid]|jgi:CheY-like chemotaxis protein|nr:MAG: response regulator [Bacteroidetes/Chlorobi group bacterium ChocPot_Mid]